MTDWAFVSIDKLFFIGAGCCIPGRGVHLEYQSTSCSIYAISRDSRNTCYNKAIMLNGKNTDVGASLFDASRRD